MPLERVLLEYNEAVYGPFNDSDDLIVIGKIVDPIAAKLGFVDCGNV